jgi:hypothetical protein
MDYGLAGQCSILRKGKRFFSTPHHPDWLWSSPTLLSSRVSGALSLEAKQPDSETDHSPPSSAMAKNGEAILPLPHMASWHNAQLTKHMGSFTFNKIISTIMECFHCHLETISYNTQSDPIRWTAWGYTHDYHLMLC